MDAATRIRLHVVIEAEGLESILIDPWDFWGVAAIQDAEFQRLRNDFLEVRSALLKYLGVTP